MTTDDGLVYREIIELRATPAQVHEFVMTPARIADYFPGAVEAGVFEEGRSIWCRGQTGVTMVERVDDESTEECLVILATTAMEIEPPFTPEAIRAAAVFTMFEDWAVAPSAEGTTLTKSWRDVTPTVEMPFPLEDAIRGTAKTETEPLVERWNEAARGV